MSAARTLDAEIKALIGTEGPISLERYMSLALGHPTLGYYMTRDPFGRSGDFITAPEISQIFGELLGLWAAVVWDAMGTPSTLRLVELGPGRGTLMADALRAVKVLAPLRAALDIHFVETSPVLRAAQRWAFEPTGIPVTWHDSLDTVPDGPAIVLANEFFDALPVRHYIRSPRGWRQRLVGLDAGRLTFGLAPDPEPSLTMEAPQGSVLEVGFAARHVAGLLGARLKQEGGAALIIDYGYAGPRLGDTLQAVREHRFSDPLDRPGEADLTAHVDFIALAQAASAAGAVVHGPVAQGTFLGRLGLLARAATLKAAASARQAADIDAAVARLTGLGTADAPGMGELFKVLALTNPGLSAPPGFIAKEMP